MNKIMIAVWCVSGTLYGALNYQEIDRIIHQALQKKVFPGAIASVGRGDQIIFRKAYGKFTYSHNATRVSVEETYYDIASITKVFTTLITLKFIESGFLTLDDHISMFFPELSEHNIVGAITIRHILTHHSGLIDFAHDGSQCLTPQEMRRFCIQQIETAVPRQKYVYSNINMVVLQLILEQISGKPLDFLLQEYVVTPLGMKSVTFNPNDNQKLFCAPTTSHMGHIFLQGVVHDANARVMGGIAGHAGLFARVEDLEIFARFFINKGKTDAGVQYVSPELIEEGKQSYCMSVRGYGWHLGRYFSPQAYGHFGFTGTSLWIDSATGYYGILLTNRAYESNILSYLVPVREAFYGVIKNAFEQEKFS